MKTPSLKSFATALFAGLVLAAGQAGAQTNLVTNGSFDQLSGSLHPTYGMQFFNAAAPTGWNTISNYYAAVVVSPTGNPYTNDWGGIRVLPGFQMSSPSGGNFILSNANRNMGASYSATPIAQQINGLTIGQNYAVTFYQAASAAQGADNTAWWDVSFGGLTQSSPVMSNLAGANSAWQAVTMNFTATSSSQALSFLANGTAPGNPWIINTTLDGVSVMAAAVPEPSTWAMMLAGIVAAGSVARRRSPAARV